MSREIILNNHNLKNIMQLKKIFNSFTFITPSCYLSKKIPGFIIMGPLPANCPLPMSPCIMRIPLTRKISFIIFTYLLNFQMNILIYLFFLSYEKENKSRLKFEAVKVLFTLETSFHRYLWLLDGLSKFIFRMGWPKLTSYRTCSLWILFCLIRQYFRKLKTFFFFVFSQHSIRSIFHVFFSNFVFLVSFTSLTWINNWS